MDKIYLPFYRRAFAKTSVLQCWTPLNPTWVFVRWEAWGFMVRSQASLKEVLDTVDKWQPKGLLPCHGKYQASGDFTWVADGCREIGNGTRKTGHPIAMAACLRFRVGSFFRHLRLAARRQLLTPAAFWYAFLIFYKPGNSAVHAKPYLICLGSLDLVRSIGNLRGALFLLVILVQSPQLLLGDQPVAVRNVRG